MEGVQKEYLELTYISVLTIYCFVCLFTYWASVCTAFPLKLKEDNKEGVQEE
jgi:hypothetical protein